MVCNLILVVDEQPSNYPLITGSASFTGCSNMSLVFRVNLKLALTSPTQGVLENIFFFPSAVLLHTDKLGVDYHDLHVEPYNKLE